jgi:hypothetical protein
MLAFQTVFDEGFRKAMPNLSKWFMNFVAHPSIVKTFGNIKPCAKAMKPFDPTSKDEDEDDLDLFGDDNEEDAAEAKKAAEKAKEANQAKKAKKVVIAQSLVMFEVKPLDDTTDLDVLAKRILAI